MSSGLETILRGGVALFHLGVYLLGGAFILRMRPTEKSTSPGKCVNYELSPPNGSTSSERMAVRFKAKWACSA
jgi:hypothetical protein